MHQIATAAAMKRVGFVAQRVGITALAREAGLPLTTVRSFRDRGWVLKSLRNCEALIAAAERLDPLTVPPPFPAKVYRRPSRARARS